MGISEVSRRVEYMARLLRGLNREELGQLMGLVPKLARAARLQQLRQEAALHFAEEGHRERDGKPPGDDEIFYGEYLSLSEAEKDALWERIWAEAEEIAKEEESDAHD